MKLSEQTISLYIAALVASTTTAFTTSSSIINHHHQQIQQLQQQPNEKAMITSSRPLPPNTPITLFGVMDEVNSGAFDLNELVRNAGGSSGGPAEPDMTKAFEILLAELVFSANDPVMDIIDKFDRCSDQRFLDWLDQKVENCTDVEEKNGIERFVTYY